MQWTSETKIRCFPIYNDIDSPRNTDALSDKIVTTTLIDLNDLKNILNNID